MDCELRFLQGDFRKFNRMSEPPAILPPRGPAWAEIIARWKLSCR